ncbi:response regulator [Flavobacteriaceae bacterium 14752]|uniref:response regulator n=1 Tax=Mesohalobacter salilacus TaxID=2491711 RepID=UPI000F636A9B|nr:response regulator [Flavobacteriaceae bacterium 14752]
MTYNTLIIDDHPTQVETYKDIFRLIDDAPALEFIHFHNLKDAYVFAINHESKSEIDLILLDINLPPYPEMGLHSGVDLAEVLKEELPQAKLCFLTSHDEAIMLYDLYTRFTPQAVLIKSDFNGEDLELFFKHMLQGKTFYTDTFLKAKQKLIDSELFLDSKNREIITNLLTHSFTTYRKKAVLIQYLGLPYQA